MLVLQLYLLAQCLKHVRTDLPDKTPVPLLPIFFRKHPALYQASRALKGLLKLIVFACSLSDSVSVAASRPPFTTQTHVTRAYPCLA